MNFLVEVLDRHCRNLAPKGAALIVGGKDAEEASKNADLLVDQCIPQDMARHVGYVVVTPLSEI